MAERNGDHNNGNGNGNGWNPFAGMPAWMRFIAIVGVPASIALFLVVRLDGRQSEQFHGLDEKVQSLLLVNSSLQRTTEDYIRDQRIQTTLLRQVCLNTAKTDAQRLECGR